MRIFIAFIVELYTTFVGDRIAISAETFVIFVTGGTSGTFRDAFIFVRIAPSILYKPTLVLIETRTSPIAIAFTVDTLTVKIAFFSRE